MFDDIPTTAKDATDINCSSCIFSSASKDAGNAMKLECRRYPPTWALAPKGSYAPPLIGTQAAVVIIKQSEWPTVGADQSCGEWAGQS